MPTKLILFEVLQASGRWGGMRNQDMVNLLYDHLTRQQHFQQEKVAKQRISAFCSRLVTKWQASRRIKSRFLANHDKWLNSEIEIFEATKEAIEKKSGERGRPRQKEENCSTRSLRRRASELRAQTDPKVLKMAATSSLYAEGDRQGAQLVAKIVDRSSERAKKIKEATMEAANSEKSQVTPFTPNEALSIMCENKLTKKQYLSLRESHNKKVGQKLYPSYESVLGAKRECYPPADSIHLSEKEASVNLQSLLDLTTNRLILSLDVVLETLSDDQLQSMTLISKWGSDGSSGHTRFKQASVDVSINDSSLYMTSFVPLQLFTIDANGQKKVVWQNPRPCSPRYGRPIKLEFTKETTDLILAETARYEEEIRLLTQSQGELQSQRLTKVTHKLVMTMIDGKVANALTGTRSSQTCNNCGATPKIINDIDKVLIMPVNKSSIQLGLPCLHAWIRTFEYLLHISYRLEVKVGQCRSVGQKESVARRKKELQTQFWADLRILVDMPKQGFGNTDDGNTARKFFHDSKTSARITGLDEELIESFSVLLRALNSGFEINIPMFRDAALRTARRCVSLYSWLVPYAPLSP